MTVFVLFEMNRYIIGDHFCRRKIDFIAAASHNKFS